MGKCDRETRVKMLKVAEENIKIKSYKYNIPGMDKKDVAQELRMKLWQASKDYDSSQSSMATFADTVISNYIIDLSRMAKAKKRQILNNSISLQDLDHDLKDKRWQQHFIVWREHN